MGPKPAIRMVGSLAPVPPIDLVHAKFVCPPPRPELCATDLVPLLTGMSAPVWRAFREGYGSEWPQGRRVVELIECRDRFM
jgi:hypothetical protein